MGTALRATSHGNAFLASIDAARSGDRSAIDDVIGESLPHITSYVRRRGSNDAEALANVIALEFISNLGRLDFASDGQAWSYIYRICRSRLVDEHRRSASRQRQCEIVEKDQPTRVFEQDVVDRLWVDDALQALTDEQRKIVELRFLSDLSIAETAERTGKTATAVKGLQRRALRQLAGVVLATGVSLAVAAAVLGNVATTELPQIQTSEEPLAADEGPVGDSRSTSGQDRSTGVAVSGIEDNQTSTGISIYGDGGYIGYAGTPVTTVPPTASTVAPAIPSAPTTTIPTGETTASSSTTIPASEPTDPPVPSSVPPTTLPSGPEPGNTPMEIPLPTAVIRDFTQTVVDVPETPMTAAADVRENLLTNGSFEIGEFSGASYEFLALPSWSTSAVSGAIEVWQSGHSGIESARGQRFVELNGFTADTIWTTVSVIPGGQYEFSFRHRGRVDSDTVEVLIGDRSYLTVSSSPGTWNSASITVTAPPDQTTMVIALRAVDVGSTGNLIDDLRLTLAQ